MQDGIERLRTLRCHLHARRRAGDPHDTKVCPTETVADKLTTKHFRSWIRSLVVRHDHVDQEAASEPVASCREESRSRYGGYYGRSFLYSGGGGFGGAAPWRGPEEWWEAGLPSNEANRCFHRCLAGAPRRIHVTEAVEVGNERSTLLHQFEQMPNLQMHLSFVKVRRQARPASSTSLISCPAGQGVASLASVASFLWCSLEYSSLEVYQRLGAASNFNKFQQRLAHAQYHCNCIDNRTPVIYVL